MRLQTITTVALSALYAVSASPLPSTLVARSEIPSAGELSSSMAVFQTLVTNALTVSAPANVSLSKRDVYSNALDSVNSIFDTIYGVADGSIAVAEAFLERRMIPDLQPLVDLLCKLLGGSCEGELIKREAPADVQFVIDTLNAWAEGTLPFTLSAASDFTPEDAIELANLLKDIVVAWRAKVDGGITSSGIISARNAAPVAKSSIYGVAGHLDKRGITRAQVKAALKVLAAAIDALADAL